MAEPGSIAERVKQQADIIRLVGDYVRLKKSGQNYLGLCPFHSEKTPSFAVHPVKQIYHCFGCGVGGDVFKFIMEIERVSFPEALRLVADKVGVRLPERRPHTPEEAKATQLRTALLTLHEQAARFYVEQLQQTKEGRLARAYLNDRGLSDEVIKIFGLGYAPGTGDALLRRLREGGASKEALEASGLVNKDDRGTLYDRFRRRVVFPIASEGGRIVAFGGRALGDDTPKYLNSPETPIYQKSRVLYNLNRAKEAIRKEGYVIVVEGYMDCIAVNLTGLANVVASCGTSLTEFHTRLLHRFTSRAVVSYDADTAGRTGTERSLGVLLTEGLDVYVVELPSADPDTYIREEGADAYRAPIETHFEIVRRRLKAMVQASKQQKQLDRIRKDSAYIGTFQERLDKEAEILKEIRQKSDAQKPDPVDTEPSAPVPYREFLISRAKELFDLQAVEGKVAALNYILPRVGRISDRVLRLEWAAWLAPKLGIEHDVLMQEFKKAASERRTEVKMRPELSEALGSSAVKPAERRLLQILLESQAIRADLLKELEDSAAYKDAGFEGIFERVLTLARAGEELSATALGEGLGEAERRLVFELAFEDRPEQVGSLEEARSCLAAMLRRKLERELREVQRQIQQAEQARNKQKVLELYERKQALRKSLVETD